MELLITALIFGFIVYLRFHADFQSPADKDQQRFQPGITLLADGKTVEALSYFSTAIRQTPRSGVAYLYRARCHMVLRNLSAAMADLERGKQYDDTIPDLHLYSGQLQFQRQAYAAAFVDFDKAVFHSRGNGSQAYYWRGLTRRQLYQEKEAEQDFTKADELTQAIDGHKQLAIVPHPISYTKRVAEALLTVINSIALVYVIKYSPTVHGPFFLAASSAGLLGFNEPRKGWLLALMQVLLISFGYTLFIRPSDAKAVSEFHLFSYCGATALTFISSYVAGFMKRQFTAHQIGY